MITVFNDSNITPITALIPGIGDLSELSEMLGRTVFAIGNFLQAVIDSILIAFILFLIIKASKKIRKDKEESATPEDILLLREIRDAPKNNQIFRS